MLTRTKYDGFLLNTFFTVDLLRYFTLLKFIYEHDIQMHCEYVLTLYKRVPMLQCTWVPSLRRTIKDTHNFCKVGRKWECKCYVWLWISLPVWRRMNRIDTSERTSLLCGRGWCWAFLCSSIALYYYFIQINFNDACLHT